jgi:hypothetical protein
MHTEAELQRIKTSLRLSQAVLSEMTAMVRMSCGGAVRIVDGRDSAEADAEAISYECWTELDFNNELKGDR